jgi:GR25 family glycosyltransferase involved in LPS biosynthesis
VGNQKSFAIFVIGTPGKLRSESLQNWLSSQSEYVVHYIDPVFRKFSTAPIGLRVYLTLHYAHPLTDGEWGCSLAHLQAQEKARELDLDLALFMEDDAKINPRITDVLREGLSSPALLGAEPAVLHGYQNFMPEIENTTHLSKELATKVPVPPVYAIAYIMNKPALEIAGGQSCKSMPIGKADFPAWSASTTWFSSPSPVAVGHDEFDSVVGDRPLASRQTGLLWQVTLVFLRILLAALPTPVRVNKFEWELAAFFRNSRLGSLCPWK